MSATYNVVEIDGHEFEVFADVATADQYLSAEPSATTYRDADATSKARWAVSATRILNRQPWPGDKEDSGQALAFPRINTGLDIVEDGIIPQAIIDAACELINQLANGYDAANRQSTAQGTKREKAGSVEVEYFRGAEGDGLRLPLPVWELISPYMGAVSSGYAGSYATGTCRESGVADGYEPSRPY